MKLPDLNSWLRWQESLHPRQIELGLERIRPVYRRLASLPPEAPVITVAGTNGKGSCVATIEAVAVAAGIRVATYTSPHLFRYNERIRIDGRPVDDAMLVRTFEAVDTARRGVPLTYFEFGTLAALRIFAEAAPELVVLEVGLGGRLDAVNIIDADVAVLTSVGLDHQAWLGFDREAIGAEKAGIFRSRRPVVLGDPDPPHSVLRIAGERGAPLHALGRDWSVERGGGAWWLNDDGPLLGPIPYGPLRSDLVNNAACGLRAMRLAGKGVDTPIVALGVAGMSLPGRLQRLEGPVEWILDLAHNVQGAQMLTQTLVEEPCAGTTRAIFGMLADKDIGGVAAVMRPCVDEWLVSGLDGSRGASAEETAAQVAAAGVNAIHVCGSVAEACRLAQQRSVPGDRIVVFGSFHVVGPAMETIGLYSPAMAAQELAQHSR
jgi:dihydrofolate synthase/folylpolyglutamate synthase